MTPSPTRIALVNTWHDDNRGDSAIAEATIGVLSDRWPDGEITVVSLLDDSHPEFTRAYRHLSQHSGEPTIVGNVLPHLDRGGGPAGILRKVLRFAARFPGATIAVAFPRLGRQPAFKAIRSAEIVVVNGGASIYSHRFSPLAWLNLYRVLLPVLFAQRTGKPVVFLGHTLGPFPDAPSRVLAGYVLRRADRVIVREAPSGVLASKLGVRPEQLDVTPDIAFALTPRSTPRVDELLARHNLAAGDFWVLTVRQIYETTQREARTKRFLSEMASFVEATLAANDTPRVVLFAHTIGPVANEDDRPITHRLKALLADDRVIVVDEDLDAGEIAAFYGNAELLVGTRLHSVILALVANTPAVAISYFGTKAQGTMALVGTPGLCIGIDEVTGPSLRELIDREDPIGHAATTAMRVTELAAEVRETAKTLTLELSVSGSS